MNAYEEYKTIIMAESNTATAARARQEAVYRAVYVYITTSVRVVRWVEETLSNHKVGSSIPLTSLSSVVLHFLPKKRKTVNARLLRVVFAINRSRRSCT